MNKCDKCGWKSGADGCCNNESVYRKYYRRKPTAEISWCNRYISTSELEKKINKKAHRRGLHKNTEYLVMKWHADGETVVEIADMLNRTCSQIRNIIKRNEGKVNKK